MRVRTGAGMQAYGRRASVSTRIRARRAGGARASSGARCTVSRDDVRRYGTAPAHGPERRTAQAGVTSSVTSVSRCPTGRRARCRCSDGRPSGWTMRTTARPVSMTVTSRCDDCGLRDGLHGCMFGVMRLARPGRPGAGAWRAKRRGQAWNSRTWRRWRRPGGPATLADPRVVLMAERQAGQG